jgi:hypothetical protein
VKLALARIVHCKHQDAIQYRELIVGVHSSDKLIAEPYVGFNKQLGLNFNVNYFNVCAHDTSTCEYSPRPIFYRRISRGASFVLPKKFSWRFAIRYPVNQYRP